jgi:LysR family glycine cleavage system transcriptional activator
MVRKLPSLNALRAFEAAARLESLTLAAGELNVAQAAISRHVRDLESWLGAKLFHRTGRGVALTQDGIALASDLSRAFDLLAAAVDRFDTKSKALVVASDVSFAALWLVPRLKRFLAGHPDVDIIVDPDPRLTDYAKGEADIGIRYGRGPWKDIASEKLFDAKSSPVCAPRILETSAVKAPADLVGQPLIREDRYDAWPAWFHAAGVTPTDALSGPQVRGELAIAAAEAGAGFALADTVQAGDALMSGRLVRPFEATVEEFSYFLVHAEGARLSKTAQAFAMWLKGECNRFADEFSEWQGRTSGQPAGHAPKAKRRSRA